MSEASFRVSQSRVSKIFGSVAISVEALLLCGLTVCFL